MFKIPSLDSLPLRIAAGALALAFSGTLFAQTAALTEEQTAQLAKLAERYGGPSAPKPAKGKTRTAAAKPAVSFKLDKKQKGFRVRANGPTVSVTAGTLNELAAGYGYYLKHGKNLMWSWSANRLAPAVPAKQKEFSAETPWEWRYAYNYCTLSYTSAFWGKTEWRNELDRMALNGVNRVLVQAGLEKVWQLTLAELGYPKEKIFAYIPSPAFAAWWNMGNLEGHGGPLTQSQIDGEAALGKFIVSYMRNYGMEPILQGFVGLVPHDFGEHCRLEGLRIIPQGNWVDGFLRPAVLDPTTPAFSKVAEVWYRNLEKVYGVKAKAFGGDLFHEGGKSGGIAVADAAKCVQTAMQKASPGSVWVLQAWHGNPSATLLSGLDKDKCVVLALCKDMVAGTSHGYSYHGAPWVWCELSNFGGNHGLYGSLKVLGKIGVMATADGSDKLVGIGLIPEGTEVNPITYDLLYDRIWTPRETVMDDAEIATWIDGYALRRYGKNVPAVNRAWKLLERSVYSPTQDQEGCTESIISARPNRNAQKASTWASGKVYWNPDDVRAAFALLVGAGEKNAALAALSTYRWDLCDIGRQFASDLARPLLAKAMEAYDAGDKKAFELRSKQFLDLIASTDRLLATHTLWRFGRMYQMALAKGKSKAEKENSARALKTLLTSWGGKPGSLNDYAHRQLSGLLKDYYLVRWGYFFDAHKKALNGDRSALDALEGKINALMNDWCKATKPVYTAKAEGKTLVEARNMLKKFAPIADELFSVPVDNDRPWTIRDGAKELVFDVSDDIMKAGTFTATFRWKSGDSALVVKRVRLYEGDKLVAEDAHRGTTGHDDQNNVYTLEVKQLRTSLDAYVLKADVEGLSSNNSSGVLIFSRAK